MKYGLQASRARFAMGLLSNKTDIHVCVTVNKSAFANRLVILELSQVQLYDAEASQQSSRQFLMHLLWLDMAF